VDGERVGYGRGLPNVHEIPLRLGKTSALDYVSGRWFLHDGKLFELQEGMRTAEATETAVRTQVTQRLQGYITANARFLQTKALSPEGDTPRLVPFRAAAAAAASQPITALPPGLGIDEVRVVPGADSIRVRVTFTNGDGQPSATFVPLALLSGEDGRELREGYGAALRLPARGRREITVALPTPASGRYLISVWPSDPKNGKPLGRGRYRIPVDVPPAP